MRDALIDVQHSGYVSRVVGNAGNLKLRNLERRGMTKLTFILVGLAGLVGDVDAGHVGDAVRNDTV